MIVLPSGMYVRLHGLIVTRLIFIAQVFKSFVKRLFQDQALNSEDLVDVLTLKDHTEGQEEFANALQIVAAAQVGISLNIRRDDCH